MIRSRDGMIGRNGRISGLSPALNRSVLLFIIGAIRVLAGTKVMSFELTSRVERGTNVHRRKGNNVILFFRLVGQSRQYPGNLLRD